MKTRNTTISFPMYLAEQLKTVAEEQSEEEDRTVTVSELIIKAVKKQYNLKKETKHGKAKRKKG